ncbi:MAG: glycoside hydrolase family 31 protein [Bacteroidota bacterium]
MTKKNTLTKQEFYPGQLVRWEKKDQLCTFYCDNEVELHLSILSPEIVRFRFSTTGFYEHDFSYALDPAFQAIPTSFQVIDRDHYISVKTAAIEIRLRKEGLLTHIYDLKGQLILEDDKGFHWEEGKHGNNIVQMSKKAQQEESYFGGGDKSCHLNLRGERIENWVTDSFGYGSDTDPLYRAIPFYFGLNEGKAYGVFFDNSFRTFFDFAKERNDATSFWSHGGEMNYYFIYGPELMEVATNYTLLTGRPEMPPLWALGFHQCRWSYFPEAEVKEIARQFRERQIPCDAIYLDIDYMDGYRCFTWNLEHFPEPDRMVAELAEEGFHTVVIIDPGIKVDPEYWVYLEGLEKDVFCRRTDGPYMKGKVWPGECYFPDFTRPDVREWWSGLFRDLIRKVKVAGVWNDMNEPAVFEVDSKTFPLDVRHDYDGHPSSHHRAHNIYGMQMARASFEGMKDFAYPNRPFLITRATYSGGQRFASAWTGDNNATWEHLQLANTQSQRMSISGISFVGSDIGGFNGLPDGELFLRWIQTGIFHPLCRVHSIGYNDVGDAAVDEDAVAASKVNQDKSQEPWSFGEPFTTHVREAIELRYRLLPYIYTTFRDHILTGKPFLRPLAFLDQHDPETTHRMEEFCVGDNILVCPISEEGVEGRYLYLPEGLWYDFDSKQPIKGEQEIWAETGLGDIPMYVRGGAILPLAPVMQYVGEKKIECMQLHAYYLKGTKESQLYSDAGDGYDYQEGGFQHHFFTLTGLNQSVNISQKREGQRSPEYSEFKVIFHGLPFKARSCTVDGKKVDITFKATKTEVIVPWDFKEIEIG